MDMFFALSLIFFSIVGKRILVLNGGYRGNEGTLESINEKTFSATIVIETVSMYTQRQEFQSALKMCHSSFSLDWSLCHFRVWAFVCLCSCLEICKLVFSSDSTIAKAFYFLITKEMPM